MFGYVIVNKGDLTFREFDVYHSYYCGLCKTLKEKYGVLGQLALNYDMTFLVMLLSSLYEPQTDYTREGCVTHLFMKRINVRMTGRTRKNFPENSMKVLCTAECPK